MKFLRRLDRDETALNLLQTHFQGHNNLVRVIGLSGQLSLDRLKLTMDRMMSVMPQLSSTISYDANGYPCFVLKEEIQWDIITYHRSSSHCWKVALEDQLNSPLNSNDLLWRLVVVHSDDQKNWELILYFHHSIADGYSSYRFLDEFMTCYSNQTFDKSYISYTKGFPKPVTDYYHSKQKGLRGLFSRLGWITTVIKETKLNQIKTRPFLGSVDNNNIARCSSFSIQEHDLSSFQLAAKEKGLTLHSALTALVFMAGKSVVTSTDKIAVVSTINTRPRLLPAASTGLAARYGNMIQVRKIEEDTDFWLLAQSLSKYAKLYLSKQYDVTSSPFSFSAIKKHCNNPSPFPYHFQLANIGITPVKSEYSAHTIRFISGAQSFKASENVIGVNALTFNRKLSINICYTSPYFNEVEIEKLIDRIKNILVNSYQP